MNIFYTDSLANIKPSNLDGFFGGWKAPHSPHAHLEILRRSAHFIIAIDPATQNAVGFVTALTDGIQAAFIPLLEVLPSHQGQGIGTELMKRLLEKLDGIPAIDLTCDPERQSFYARLGMQPSVGMVIRTYAKQESLSS